jgi:hypothetical protein
MGFEIIGRGREGNEAFRLLYWGVIEHGGRCGDGQALSGIRVNRHSRSIAIGLCILHCSLWEIVAEALYSPGINVGKYSNAIFSRIRDKQALV